MDGSTGSIEYWRQFFRSTSFDIFRLIEKAILVAAVDCPKEFKNRRDQIAEMLFTSGTSYRFGCDAVELQIPADGDDQREECRSVKRELEEKYSNADSFMGEFEDFSNGGVSNYSYNEAEALTEVIEEENQMIGEVLRIKEVLENKHDESEAVLYDSLRRLQLMQLSVETLKATEIGKAVNNLRKQKSKQIRSIIRTLIVGWKEMVDEWVKSTAAITDHSSDSVNRSMVDDEEGLPSPPMDEGALFVTQTTSMELSKFFDGMDEDGNYKISGKFNEKNESGSAALESRMLARGQEAARHAVISKEKARNMKTDRHEKPQTVNFTQPKSQGIVIRLKPSKQACEQKPGNQISGPQQKPSIIPHNESKQLVEASHSMKLEITKRKLQEGYQQIENAKKQRTIQLVELHDLPKQPQSHRSKNMKPRNQSRAYGC